MKTVNPYFSLHLISRERVFHQILIASTGLQLITTPRIQILFYPLFFSYNQFFHHSKGKFKSLVYNILLLLIITIHSN